MIRKSTRILIHRLKVTITLLIAVIIFLIGVLSAMVTKAQARESLKLNVASVRELDQSRCKKMPGGIEINGRRIYIHVTHPYQTHVIKNSFHYNSRIYYDLKSDTCSGFFIYSPDHNLAILSVHTKKRGYYTCRYVFQK